jgi:acyl carrier protein
MIRYRYGLVWRGFAAMRVMTDARDGVMERLQSVFRDVFNDDAIVLRPDMTAADIPAWDSLSNINLIIASEIAFGVRLKPREINALANVGDMVAHLGRAMEAGLRR